MKNRILKPIDIEMVRTYFDMSVSSWVPNSPVNRTAAFLEALSTVGSKSMQTLV